MFDEDDEQISVESTDEREALIGESPQEIRRRTFSHWSNSTSGFIDQMVNAGLYSCNVEDCTVCPSCKLIFHKWIPDKDDPCEVHKCLSPSCKYVQRVLAKRTPQSTTVGLSPTARLISNPFSDEFKHSVIKVSQSSSYSEVTHREKSYHSWNHSDSPPVDKLITAGFFYTGVRDKVTCFYCKGSLDQWKSDDNPMMKHARCLPDCGYIRQLCGEDLYQRVQIKKRIRIEQFSAEEWIKAKHFRSSQADNLTINRFLLTTDANSLLQLIHERLSWPMSKNLLSRKYSLEIIKKCWKYQLTIKGEDFVSEADLRIACVILRNYMENVDNSARFIVPSVGMQKFRKLQASTINNSQTVYAIVPPDLSTVCIMCLKNDKGLACIPCGHLYMCQSCGSSTSSCRLCGKRVEALIRVYI